MSALHGLATQPTVFDRAIDRLTDAIAACERQALREAIEAMRAASKVLETEEHFRAARRGAT